MIWCEIFIHFEVPEDLQSCQWPTLIATQLGDSGRMWKGVNSGQFMAESTAIKRQVYLEASNGKYFSISSEFASRGLRREPYILSLGPISQNTSYVCHRKHTLA